MKRTADTDNSTDPASSSNRIQGKRPKSSQACSSCRKHKTRCELLDNPSEGPYRCHRCKVLNISCSFESSEFAPPLQQQSPSPTPFFPRPTYITSSSRISPPNISNNGVTQENDTRSVKLEDLLPLPPKPWGFVKIPGGFDWSTTPMLAMQGITTSRPQLDEDQLISDVNASLANILSADRVSSLLNIFETIYSPWLNLQPDQGRNCPMLTLARLMVASRHLDPVTRAAVVPQLQKLTGEVLYRHLFNPIPSTQSIQAIIILSLWSPIGATQASVRDGRLLIASGVSMAMNLRLSQAVEYVSGLRSDMKKDKGVSDPITSDLEDAMEKARLWLCLVNAESMLCIGTGRVPLSRRTELDLTMIDSSSAVTVESARDMRLSLMGQIFEVTEKGLRIHFSSKSEFDKFYKEVVGVLMELDNLLRLISPLPVVVEHESSYFHTLRIYHHICRLLFIHHCLHETRRVVTIEPMRAGRPWYLLAQYNGVNLAAQWGQEALLLAEDILSSTISQPESSQLGSAPDNVFAMVCFAAAFIVMCKISVYQTHGEHISGSSDGLLAKIIERLLLDACGPDHASAKCAQLISKLVASYEARVAKCNGEPEHQGLQVMLNNISSERTSVINQELESTGFGVDEPPHFDASLSSYGVSLDLNRLMNSDVMLDSDFWASFMDNLTTDVPYGEGVRGN